MNDPFEPREGEYVVVESFEKSSGWVSLRVGPVPRAESVRTESMLRRFIDLNLFDTRWVSA